jgi:subtilase family serine protease
MAKLEDESLTASAESQVAGGGGFSTMERRPSYQDDLPGIGEYHAVKYLTPTDSSPVTGTANLVEPTEWSFNPTPRVTSGYSSGRAVPDLSADADPYTGYLLYEPSARAAGEAAQPLHPAERGRHQQRQHLLHRQPRLGLQRGQRARFPT